MLSRHAEGLFWLGRYVERAADITRMLNVAYHGQLETSSRSSNQVWGDLLRVLYLEEQFAEAYGDEVTTPNMNRFLVFDRSNPSSVASSVQEARTNVMNVRDAVPNELLEAVNRLHTRLGSDSLTRDLDYPHQMYEIIGGACRSITGAVAESMSRNDEYRFLMLGRLLERAEMTCRMIDVNRRSEDLATWMLVLRSVSGFHSFIRAHGPLAPTSEVVAFLLREPSFPFSVLHCLTRAGHQAEQVSGTGHWEAPRALGRVASELQYANLPSVASSDLGELLKALEENIRTISEALHEDLYQFGGELSLYSFEAL